MNLFMGTGAIFEALLPPLNPPKYALIKGCGGQKEKKNGRVITIFAIPKEEFPFVNAFIQMDEREKRFPLRHKSNFGQSSMKKERKGGRERKEEEDEETRN
jgi:hypothetical protein